MLHIWNIYLHLGHLWGQCWYIFHTWSIWIRIDPYLQSLHLPEVEGEKRALYASYRSELLSISSAEVSIRNGPRSPGWAAWNLDIFGQFL